MAMQRWRGVDSAPGDWGRSVITIGVFDGVHRGHQQIIGHAVRRAAELRERSAVVTFDPHPSEVVRPGSHPPVLTPQRRKAELIEALGVNVLCVIPFTVGFSRLTPAEFVHDVLVEHLHAQLVVVGENFRFGHRAAGDLMTLRELGAAFGFAAEGAPLVSEDGTTFSSTYIRSCVAAGDVRAAAAALGRPHRVDGVVVRGDQRGRFLGYPTANLETPPHTAVPADGIYAAWLVRRGERLAAAVSIGTNPTFSGRERRIEAFVLDTTVDLYGEHVALDVVERLRPTERFDTVEALIKQMDDDVVQTRIILGLPPAAG
jgi:riboflavin kinase/FMN adenylyltransferase